MANVDRATEFPDGITFGGPSGEQDLTGVFTGTADPSINNEIAPVGSLYLRSNGETWLKTGAGNSEWTLVANSTGIGGGTDKNVHLLWNFDTTTTAADPGPGNFRYNTATAGSITNIYISVESSNGIDASSVLSALSPGETIYIQQAGSPSKSILFTVSSIVDNASWINITVTVEDNNAIPDNGSECGVLVIYTGQVAIAMDDLSDADTTTVAPDVGDNLKWDGTNWVPSSAVSGVQSSSNYFFVYKTLVQQVATRATFEDIAFDQEAFVQGWTHIALAAEFTCEADGMYIGTLEIGVEKSGGNGVESAIRAVINTGGGFGEVPGSHNGMDITSNNTIFAISRTFIFQASIGDVLKMQYATDSNGSFNVGSSAKITPVPTANADISTVSATFVIRRMT
jgi:hypothetical protein